MNRDLRVWTSDVGVAEAEKLAVQGAN